MNNTIFITLIFYLLTKEGGERERPWIILSLTYAFNGCFLYVPLPGMEPVHLMYWDDTNQLSYPARASCISFYNSSPFWYNFNSVISVFVLICHLLCLRLAVSGWHSGWRLSFLICNNSESRSRMNSFWEGFHAEPKCSNLIRVCDFSLPMTTEVR